MGRAGVVHRGIIRSNERYEILSVGKDGDRDGTANAPCRR